MVSVSKKASNSYEAIGDRLVQMVNDGEITTIAEINKQRQVFIDDGLSIE